MALCVRCSNIYLFIYFYGGDNPQLQQQFTGKYCWQYIIQDVCNNNSLVLYLGKFTNVHLNLRYGNKLDSADFLTLEPRV